MKTRHIAAFIGSLCLLSTLDAGAADAEHGKALHDTKCTGCHGSQMYTRPNRKIHNLQELRERVEFCDNAAKAGLDKDDRDAVILYLNRDFYKFPDLQ